MEYNVDYVSNYLKTEITDAGKIKHFDPKPLRYKILNDAIVLPDDENGRGGIRQW